MTDRDGAERVGLRDTRQLGRINTGETGQIGADDGCRILDGDRTDLGIATDHGCGPRRRDFSNCQRVLTLRGSARKIPPHFPKQRGGRAAGAGSAIAIVLSLRQGQAGRRPGQRNLVDLARTLQQR
ncbi:unannotated protein [freshwater metagenome]|uniref:Unannotated protein n=1 Tax=freshwater metagenome TaxID=449393 RepID=A0A6J6ZA58_9ZZZZ